MKVEKKALKRALLAILYFLSAALAAGAFTRANLYSGNTLEKNGRWMSTKVALERGVVGAVATFLTQPALARERLNLGAWFGYQEFFFVQPLDAEILEFDFFLSADSYFTFFFRRNEDGFEGVRVSNLAAVNSAFLAGHPERGFRAKIELPPLGLAAQRSYHARLELGASEAVFFIDGKKIGVFPSSLPSPAQFGFRGSHVDTFVDNVRVQERGAERWITEDFANHGNARFVFVCALLLLLGTGAAGILSGYAHAPVWLVYANCLLALAAFAYHAYDWRVRSPLYPPMVAWNGYRENIESQDDITKFIRAKYGEKSRDRRRVLFLGSSQTWGAGARFLRDTFVERLEARMKNVEFINGAISGAQSHPLVQLYKTDWQKLDAELVIVNLGSNDDSSFRYGRVLRELVELTRARGVKLLFVLEPNHPFLRKQILEENHEAMRKLGKELDVPVADLDAHLLERADTGFLWWDFVHLSSYGQKLTADFLEPWITRALALRH